MSIPLSPATAGGQTLASENVSATSEQMQVVRIANGATGTDAVVDDASGLLVTHDGAITSEGYVIDSKDTQVMRRLSVSDAGSTYNANGDYSGAATRFQIRASTTNRYLLVSRLHVFMRADAVVDIAARGFGKGSAMSTNPMSVSINEANALTTVIQTLIPNIEHTADLALWSLPPWSHVGAGSSCISFVIPLAGKNGLLALQRDSGGAGQALTVTLEEDMTSRVQDFWFAVEGFELKDLPSIEI